MNLQFLIGPLVGAVIGGITNGIAIKMLFRPLNPVKIGNYTLPFTPGVIPKEKDRIARKIGEVISKELLNAEVLKEWLLKEEIYDQIGHGIMKYLEKAEGNEATIEERLKQLMGEERVTFLTCEIEEDITDKLYHKVVEMHLGQIIVEKLKEKVKGGSLGSLLGPMSFFVNDSLIENIAVKLEPMLDDFIVAEGEGIIRRGVEEESKEMLGMPIKDLAGKVAPYEEMIVRVFIQCYKSIINNYLVNILDKINISQIVEERIHSLEMLEIERIILSIMHKELNAIVWLGVLLGGIMGCITSLL